jgi:hypothetical protein
MISINVELTLQSERTNPITCRAGQCRAASHLRQLLHLLVALSP